MKKYLIILLLFFSGCTPEQDVTFKPELKVFEGRALTFFNELNDYRESIGLKRLIGEKTITGGCVTHAGWMNDHGASHDGFYNRSILTPATYFGEVISVGYNTAESQISAYQNSISHFSALINPNYTHIGIAQVGEFQCVNLAGYSGNHKSVVTEQEILIKK